MKIKALFAIIGSTSAATTCTLLGTQASTGVENFNAVCLTVQAD
jgi:hypothetical protein